MNKIDTYIALVLLFLVATPIYATNVDDLEVTIVPIMTNDSESDVIKNRIVLPSIATEKAVANAVFGHDKERKVKKNRREFSKEVRDTNKGKGKGKDKNEDKGKPNR